MNVRLNLVPRPHPGTGKSRIRGIACAQQSCILEVNKNNNNNMISGVLVGSPRYRFLRSVCM